MSRWALPVRLERGPVVLEPLSPDHADGLAEAVRDGELWRLWYTSVPRPEAVAAMIEQRLKGQSDGTWLPFAVIEAGTGRALGATGYLHIESRVRRLEIGGTWYRRSVQGSGVNVACKRLLLGHAFEALDCMAVEFRTHALNRRSRGAIEGLGAKLDGVLRNHFDPAGNPRDTCVYSIVASEWPMVRRHLDWRLSRHEPARDG